MATLVLSLARRVQREEVSLGWAACAVSPAQAGRPASREERGPGSMTETPERRARLERETQC